MQYAYLSFMERRALETDGLFASDAGEGIYMVYDLGRNEVGLMDVELTVDEDTEVLIGWGEHLDDLRVRSYGGHSQFLRAVRRAEGAAPASSIPIAASAGAIFSCSCARIGYSFTMRACVR